MRWLVLIATVQLLIVTSVLSLFAQRRIALVRAQRRRDAAMARLREVAVALIVDGEPPPDLSRDRQKLLAEVLWVYSRQITGASRANIATYFESVGLVDDLLRSLGRRRAWRRAAAAYSLGDTCSMRAVPGLVNALRDPARPVRTAAVRSLGRLRAAPAAGPLSLAIAARSVPLTLAGTMMLRLGPDAAPSLRRLLAHTDPAVRALGLQLAGLLGAAGEVPVVRPFCRDDDDARVRATACLALARLGSGEVAGDLRAALRDVAPEVRAAAAQALGDLGDRDSVPLLLAGAAGDDFEPGNAAARAAARLDGAAVDVAAGGPDAVGHLREAADAMRARSRVEVLIP